MSIFRELSVGVSALEEYLEAKRREFIGASGDDLGSQDALRLEADLLSLDGRIERKLLADGRDSLCYLVMGRVQSGKTGHQLGMLSWAADKCDVAVIFTGVTEALNGQTSYRIAKDLGTLPSNPVSTLTVPTRTRAENDDSFLQSVLRRTKQRRDFREGEGMWPERLPILVAMKTKPRVDALQWLFKEVADRLGEGVTALIIDDEADQASPNAAARKNEEAATYAQLKELRNAATNHVWLSYTATPQAIFLTEQDGALRPDYCAVSRPGADYFGVTALMEDARARSRIIVHDWPTGVRKPGVVPGSLKRAVCDLLAAAWVRTHMVDAFYSREGAPAVAGMRSVQMLVHTSVKLDQHALDFAAVELGIEQVLDELEAALRAKDPSAGPNELRQAWEALAGRLHERLPAVELPELALEQLWQLGLLARGIEKRVVNSDPKRPTASAGPLPTERAGWEAHPIWIIIGGDILGRGLTIPQLVTTYFTRLAQAANEDTVAQQMRFCGYRGTYAHMLTLHAVQDIFDSFDYLASVERALLASAEEWEDKDKNLRRDRPALYYVSRSTRRMKPTRLAVRDRELVDTSMKSQVLSLRQISDPEALLCNSTAVLEWLRVRGSDEKWCDEWSLTQCDSKDVSALVADLKTGPRDGHERDVAVELMNPIRGDLGLADVPCAVFVRGHEHLRRVASGLAPDRASLLVRRLADPLLADAGEEWELAWGSHGGFRPERWFDSARLGVPHVGDGQRKPIKQLNYEALAVIIEPLGTYWADQRAPEGAGLAVSVLAPDGFEVRVIGVQGAE